MRAIYRTIEKNTYISEKRKQDWIDKALEQEEKKRQRHIENAREHDRRLDEMKKREFYRDTVKMRNQDIMEQKKAKTLWKLEKMELKAAQRGKSGASRFGGSQEGSEDRGGLGKSY